MRTWHVYGMGESHIDHRLAGLVTGVEGATLHFRTSIPDNHVKVVVRGRAEEAHATLERIDAELRKRIGPGIYAVDGESFPAAVAKSLRAQDARRSPSPSRARAASWASSSPRSRGRSSFFRGSIVAYSDDVKTSVLGVKPETLADYGAVSEPTAREMAEGAKRVCGSSVAVAITGVAGPDGGTPDKPVGTVCFAVCGPGTTRTSTKLFAGNRERVRDAAAYYALDLRAALLRHAQEMTTTARQPARADDPQLRGGAAAGDRRANGIAAAGELARALPRDVKWTRKPENLHVTMKFLGPVGRRSGRGFGGALAASLQACRPSSSRCAASARSRRRARRRCSSRASPTTARAGALVAEAVETAAARLGFAAREPAVPRARHRGSHRRRASTRAPRSRRSPSARSGRLPVDEVASTRASSAARSVGSTYVLRHSARTRLLN